MSTTELYYKSVSELSTLLNTQALSSVELTQAFLNRTHAVEPQVKAFISINEETTLAEAKASDERRANGATLGPLDGIPVGIKDNIAQKKAPLTCASYMLKDYVSPYDATVITKLKHAGAVLLGRLNLDEFAMGSSTEHSYFKKTTNPWDVTRIPGGSSGGSAAAVAAGSVPLALGSDTGGSIRQPASLCGVVGLKPTYGRVSRYGLAAFASSLDQIGPMGASIKDVALLLDVISGHDALDSTSAPLEIPSYSAGLKNPLKPTTIGIPKEYFEAGLDSEIRSTIETAIEFYKQQGFKIKSVSLPNTDLATAVYYLIATAEASSNLARYDGIRYTYRDTQINDPVEIYFQSREKGFGDEVKRRIMLGTYILSSGYYDAFYLRAQKVRRLIYNDFMSAFEGVDALLTPTTPTVAFKMGQKSSDPFVMYLSDIYTISVNLAGLPALSVPCGLNSEGLPIGLQIIGKPFEEMHILALGHIFEQAHTFYKQRPVL